MGQCYWKSNSNWISQLFMAHCALEYCKAGGSLHFSSVPESVPKGTEENCLFQSPWGQKAAPLCLPPPFLWWLLQKMDCDSLDALSFSLDIVQSCLQIAYSLSLKLDFTTEQKDFYPPWAQFRECILTANLDHYFSSPQRQPETSFPLTWENSLP